MTKKVPLIFIFFGLICLLFGALIGILIAGQYLDPAFLKNILPFNQLREIHVSTVVSWIILTATGGVYYYIQYSLNLPLYSKNLAKSHLFLYLLTGIGIYVSMISGNMGGREYLTFFPLLILPILAGWVLFGINYFKTLIGSIKGWPVYLWMWGTGIVFMTYHISESNFWIFSHFRENFIRDFSIQWKSYGSFVGSWNMLVYGTAIFLMARIKGDENVAKTKTAFFFYFLGLTNLMFGWAHHIYPVPTAAWIRGVAYFTSMTEWIILGSMITAWIRSLTKSEKKMFALPYGFLLTTDVWIFANVLVAILISIPAINHYTHGTHLVVAHSMGTTIGINTSILLSSALFIVSRMVPGIIHKSGKVISVGMLVFNISLAVFLGCLIAAGYQKTVWSLSDNPVSFGQLQQSILPYLRVFLYSGVALFVGLLMISAPLLKGIIALLKSSK